MSGYRGGRGDFRGSGFSADRSRGRGRGGFSSRDRGSDGDDSSSSFINRPLPESVKHPILVRQRMDRGTVGTEIPLIANFYKLETEPQIVYHYDVDITKSSRMPTSDDQPPTEAFLRFLRKFSTKIIEKVVQQNPAIFADVPYVYDRQKNLYTTKSLPILGSEVSFEKIEVNLDGGGLSGLFNITIKPADQVNMSQLAEYYSNKSNKLETSERIVSIFDLVFHFISSQNYTNFQRKFYDFAEVQKSPKVRVAEFVSGFIQSVRMTEFGLALNVHLKTACIISRSFTKVIELVKALLGGGGANLQNIEPKQLREVNRLLRQMKIFTAHTPKLSGAFLKITYTIDRLIVETPQQLKFTKDGRELTIAEYFLERYNLELQPLPLVRTTGKKHYLPLELCYLVDRQFLANSKLDQTIQRELLLKSTHSPNVYFNKLNRIINNVATINPPLHQAFGVKSICTKPVQLIGRVLPPPAICEGDNRTYYEAGQIPVRWGVFSFDHQVDNEDLRSFAEQLMAEASKFGLHFAVAPKPLSKVEIKSKEAIGNVFTRLFTKTNTELIFVGLPSFHKDVSSSDMYGLIKHYCDQSFGIISCCFKAHYMGSIPRGYFENFLLKVNGKLGGQNQILQPTSLVELELPFRPTETMIIGIDVTHRGAAEVIASSIAGAVGSYNEHFTKYSASIRIQKKTGEEILTQLDDMIFELLHEYKRYNKDDEFPENVLVYRDGVSEGQFEKVRNVEIELIRKAFKRIKKPEIRLTVLVIQKGHHTRFIRTTAAPVGRNNRTTYNVPSGTVVDQSIVEPHYDVFYLNSHFSPLGTSKPTKYTILRNGHQLNANQIQQFSYYICHNCTRTRKVISIPTPVRYAHLLAHRSKIHLESQRDGVLSTGSSTSRTADENEEDRLIAELNQMVKAHDRVRHRLYYS